MEAITLGALFLLSVFVPAYSADPSVASAGSDTSLQVVLGIGSAAGVGALLSLTGRAVWNFVWPYSPTGGWRQLSKRFYGKPKVENAQTLGRYWELAQECCPAGGDQAIMATAYLLYSEAPAEVRGWIRRRHDRFSDALCAVAAIVMGVLAGALLFPAWNGARWALLLGFLLIALATFAHAFEGRNQAVEMESYWFAVRADASLRHEPITHVAFDPAAELSIRPKLR